MSKANSHLLPWSSRRSERSFSSSPEGRGFFLRGHTSVLFCTQGTNPNWEGEGEGEGKSARALLTPFLLLLPLLIPAPKEEIELTSDFYSILSVHFQREDEVGGWVVVRGGGKRTRREGKGREGERGLCEFEGSSREEPKRAKERKTGGYIGCSNERSERSKSDQKTVLKGGRKKERKVGEGQGCWKLKDKTAARKEITQPLLVRGRAQQQFCSSRMM